MSGPPDLPLWAALLVSFFLVGGAGLTLIGAVGVLRLPMLPSLLVLVPVGLVAASLGARRV